MDLFRTNKKSDNTNKSASVKVEDFARIINTDKLIINNVSDICFRRCIASFEKEYLNPLE